MIDPNSTFNTFDGENLKIASGNARATLQNISSGEDFVKVLETDKAGNVYKTAIAQEGAIIATGDDLADIYVSKKSGVDFSAYDESLAIDLSKNFYDINQITVGGGLNTLIINFAADKISVGSAVSNVVLRNSGDVIIQLGDEWITLEDAQGKNFRINEVAAQVDTNITYDDAANYFLATSKNASVIVCEEAEIWLDASDSDGKNTLAGNDNDNEICAGGGSLQIDSCADITYQLADGSQFSTNNEQTAWITKN